MGGRRDGLGGGSSGLWFVYRWFGDGLGNFPLVRFYGWASQNRYPKLVGSLLVLMEDIILQIKARSKARSNDKSKQLKQITTTKTQFSINNEILVRKAHNHE